MIVRQSRTRFEVTLRSARTFHLSAFDPRTVTPAHLFWRAGRDGPLPNRGPGPAVAGTTATTDPILIMTTEPINLYAILGLARDATQAQISVAYRTLLRRYHPDTRPPADTSRDALSDAALQHVLSAYAVVRDPVRRFDYDQRTTPRSAPARPPARPIRPSWIRRFEGPLLRAGPVHWTP